MKDLEKLTVKELRALAAKKGIRGRSRMRKPELVKALQSLDISHESRTTIKEVPKEESQPSKVTTKPVPLKDPLEDIGELPYSYGKDLIELLPVNPETMYAYWDVSASVWREMVSAQGVLFKVEDGQGKAIVEASIDKDVREYFFKVEGRGPYRSVIELVFGNERRRVLESRLVKAPPNVPGQAPVRFVKVPWNIPLWSLKGRLLEPAPTELPKGDFLVTEPDTTPYTRRWK